MSQAQLPLRRDAGQITSPSSSRRRRTSSGARIHGRISGTPARPPSSTCFALATIGKSRSSVWTPVPEGSTSSAQPRFQSKPETSMPSVFETAPTQGIPITFATKATWDAIQAESSAPARQFALANGFAAKPGACLALPAADGQIAQVIFGLEETRTANSATRSGPACCPGCCRPASIASPIAARHAPRGARFRARRLSVQPLPQGGYTRASGWCRRTASMSPTIARMAEAAMLARDLINTPSNDMGPEELAKPRAISQSASAPASTASSATISSQQNFPLIHAVGMASTRAPRLIDLTWGDRRIPR